jgi:hypothetical protein
VRLKLDLSELRLSRLGEGQWEGSRCVGRKRMYFVNWKSEEWKYREIRKVKVSNTSNYYTHFEMSKENYWWEYVFEMGIEKKCSKEEFEEKIDDLKHFYGDNEAYYIEKTALKFL